MSPDLIFCPKCIWFRERIIGLSTEHPWCEHPAHLNSTIAAYPVKYDLPSCGSFDAKEATPSAKSCHSCNWYIHNSDTFCKEPRWQTALDMLKSHIQKEKGCSFYASEDTKATCGDCDWYTEKGGYCKHGHHFTKPDKTACIEHYNPKNESTISTCSDCKHFQSAIERCAKRTEQETEFCAKPQNIACTTFFEPKEKPKHICSDCELYKFDKSKPDDPFHKCTLPPGHYCSPTHEACLKFKKKSKNTCDECYFYEKKVDGPVTTQHCNKQNSFAFATSDGKACKEFKPKVKKISPKRTCKQCHWMRSENGNHHTCVSHEDIEHVIHPDADATNWVALT